MPASGDPLDGIAEIREDMPAVGHLLNGQSALTHTIGVGSATVTTHSRHGGMPAQPSGNHRGCAVR